MKVIHEKPDVEPRSFLSENDRPPCTIGEKVMVDTQTGLKFGKVKFIGSTEFAAGEWIGVALERPTGEFAMHEGITPLYAIVTILGRHDGTVESVQYFKCKDAHGLFVRRDKIIRNPAINHET